MKTRRNYPAEFNRQLRTYGASAAGRSGAKPATRWISYTAAAGVAFTLTPDLEAVPVFGTGPLTVVFTGPKGSNTVQVNLDGDANADFRFKIKRQTGVSGTAAVRSGRALAYGINFNGILGGSDFYAFRATAGPSFNVGSPKQPFYAEESLRDVFVRHKASSHLTTAARKSWPGGPNFGDTEGYLGVKFKDSGAQNHFGWIHLSVRNDAEGKPDGIKILDWAYESEAGVALHVTDSVPEIPTSAVGLGVLALGAAGIQRLRQKRRTVAAED